MALTSAFRAPILAALAALALAACQGREKPLPGERELVRPDAVPTIEATRAIALPPPIVNAEWSHRNGSSAGRFTHLAFSQAPQIVWRADAGVGDARRRRILAAPIVAGGRVFTLDADANLSAFAALSGELLWRRSVAAVGQRADSGPGGGMSEANGVLYVATGFGEAMALDPATGAEKWRASFEAPVRGAPTVEDGMVFVVTRNDVGLGLDAQTGAVRWRVQGTGGPGILGGSSPAVDGPLAVIPFASGEVLGVLSRNGLQLWGTAVTGGRRELVRNRISDITGDPVIDGDTVYASNQSGRTVSIDRISGERRWTMPEGSYGPAWPVGGSVFLLSDLGSLVRVDAATGAVYWIAEMPEYPNKKRKAAIVYFGPILAGGRLWVASSDGLLRSFSPNDGQLLSSLEIPGGAAAAPAVARGMMYIVTRDGKLLAFQ